MKYKQFYAPISTCSIQPAPAEIETLFLPQIAQAAMLKSPGFAKDLIKIFAPPLQSFFGKVFLLVCILSALGLPVQAPFLFFFFLIACLTLITGNLRINALRGCYILGSLALVISLKLILPGANIEEGHNLFFTKDTPNEIFSKSLPPQVYQLLVKQFKDQYPPESGCSLTAPGCWRESKLPAELFAFSEDSVFRNPKYSRVVDSIDFDSLEMFRGGFVNSLAYNWWDRYSDVKRENMPYFVMYELSREAVGSNLCWKGHVFWETDPEHFEHLHNISTSCRPIKTEDIGKKLYGVSVLKSETLAISLKLSTQLEISSILKMVLSVAGTLIILALGIRPKFQPFIVPAIIIVLTLVAIPKETLHSFARYIIQEGTNDGLVHEGYGRNIFKHMLHGEIKEALRGEESAFYFMPGLRYFFALEKLFFGDTGWGKLCILLLMPISYYFLLRVFLPALPSSLLLLLFLFVTSSHHIHNGLTLRAYTNIAARGEAEVLGYSLFVFGLALILKYYNRSYEKFYVSGVFANLLIALSVFVRPNLVLPAFSFFLFLAWNLYNSNRTKDFFIIFAGFLPFLLIPAHNYYYGQTWALLTAGPSVKASFALGVSPSEYLETFRAYIMNNPDGGHFHKIQTHLEKWVESRWWRAYFFALSMLALFPFLGASFQLRSIAWVCFSSHLMLFFFQSWGRYALLAWLLSAVIVFVMISHALQSLPRMIKQSSLKTPV